MNDWTNERMNKWTNKQTKKHRCKNLITKGTQELKYTWLGNRTRQVVPSLEGADNHRHRTQKRGGKSQYGSKQSTRKSIRHEWERKQTKTMNSRRFRIRLRDDLTILPLRGNWFSALYTLNQTEMRIYITTETPHTQSPLHQALTVGIGFFLKPSLFCSLLLRTSNLQVGEWFEC